MTKTFLSIATLIASTSLYAAPEPSVSMGKAIFGEVEKSNSCAFCHGATGEGGSVKTAAHLTQPKTWKIYKILGGDGAYAKNKADFLGKMKKATVNLIAKSAVAHNVTFKKDNPWFDMAAAKVPSYDAQMLGLMGGPSKSWLKKFKDKGVTVDIAANSAYLFVQSLDKQGVFK